MITFTQIKSRGQKLLDRLNALAEAIDYDPGADMLERIRKLERELAALNAAS